MTAGLLPSAEAELRNRPQAEKSTEWTACLWPRKSRHTRPVAISHTSTAMSSPAEAMYFPLRNTVRVWVSALTPAGRENGTYQGEHFTVRIGQRCPDIMLQAQPA